MIIMAQVSFFLFFFRFSDLLLRRPELAADVNAIVSAVAVAIAFHVGNQFGNHGDRFSKPQSAVQGILAVI